MPIKGKLKPVKRLFESLKVGEARILKKPKVVYNHKLYIARVKLADEYLIVVTNRSPHNALETYKLRWEIDPG